jgi:hypothetical protein
MWNPSPDRQRQSQLLHDCSPPHQWQRLYRAAILGTDPSFVRERINRAERAIADRRHELARPSGNMLKSSEKRWKMRCIRCPPSNPHNRALRQIWRLEGSFPCLGRAKMLDKCANPACSEIFRRLRDGRVFVIEVESSASSPPHQRQHFWLCNSCCRSMMVVVDKDKGVQVRPRPESETATQAAS